VQVFFYCSHSIIKRRSVAFVVLDPHSIIKRRSVAFVVLDPHSIIKRRSVAFVVLDPHSIIKNRSVAIPLTVLTLPHFCAWPKTGPGFPTSHVSFLFAVGLK